MSPVALQRAVADPNAATPADILALQHSYGNQAVQRLVSRRAVQAKLTVGPAGDHYEQEADRVADQVMRMLTPRPASRPSSIQRSGEEDAEAVQTKPLAGTITPLVQRQAEEEEEVQTKPLVQRQAEEEEEVQTKPLVQRQAEEEEEVQTKPQEAGAGFETSQAVEGQLRAARGSGQPLPADVRSYMEPRFGADFSSVRVHTDGQAAQLNRQLSAQAFTHGEDIYVPADKYAPQYVGGRRLLAHELTHVIQQKGHTDRVARWGAHGGGTSHTIITQQGFGQLDPNIRKWYSKDAQEYLAVHSEDMDARGSFWAMLVNRIGKQTLYKWTHHGMYSKGPSQKKLNKLTSGEKEEAKMQRARKYDDMIGYSRDPSEAVNHAEAGQYKRQAEGVNIARRDAYIEKAVRSWKQGDPRQGIHTLSLALHLAQDRGAHGDGKPGLGHDPRRLQPPPPGAKMGWVFYDTNPGWKEGDPVRWKGGYCDSLKTNSTGYIFSVFQTVEVLTKFVNDLGIKGEDQVSEEEMQAGGGLSGFKKPGKMSRFGRKVANFFGKDIIQSR
jgi:hypothetical protein